MGSSRISTLAPGLDEDGQRQAPALASGEHLERLLGVLSGEQEPAEQPARIVRRQLGQMGGGLEHGARGPGRELLGVLGEEPELDVVAGPELALDDRPGGRGWVGGI